MGKGLGGCLGEGGECAEPNRPADGDNHWKGVGEVKDASRREVEQGLSNLGELKRIDGDELGSSDKLDSAGKLPKVNDETGRAKFVSITGVVEVEGDVNGKTVSLNLT